MITEFILNRLAVRINYLSIILLAAGFIFLASCYRLPDRFSAAEELPDIFPDIAGVSIPVNIAPLNFRLDSKPRKTLVTLEGRNSIMKTGGKNKIRFRVKKWHKFLEQNKGGEILFTVYTKNATGWERHLPFSIFVKELPADPYLVYRRIAPGYESWSRMGIYQRNISNFDEDVVLDNRMLTGNCMNCHSFSNHNPEMMMLHLRGKIAGTLIARDGDVIKIDTRTKETKYNCVYPYWHPSGRYIAFSVNNISQVFHSVKEKRIEVMDSESDLVVYDINSNVLIRSRLVSSEDSFETFPAFSADGRELYFCSARKENMPSGYDNVRYSLCKTDFDPDSGTFGRKTDTLISEASTGKSISFPRASPDGKYLMFTMSDYGNFSIWHKEADLYLLDLSSGSYHPLDAANSGDTESYHSWSSGSRWFVFSSRRIDGLYTRLYLSFLNEDGTATKPFLLPQKDPDYYDYSLYSFNVPEFVRGRVRYKGRSMINTIGSEPKSVIFEAKD
jgi:Tol biopolymer transport system component